MPEAKQKGKGSAQWKPANRLGTVNKKEGYGYRFLRNEPEHIQGKIEEGWVIPNATNGLAGEFLEEHDKASGGRKHKELILAVMDNETIKARTEYFDNLTNQSEQGLKKNLARDLAASSPKASPHGAIVIE